MSFSLSQVMADLDSEVATMEGSNQKNTNKKRTLKRKPEPNLNKLKTSTVSAPPLSDSIYLDEPDAEQETGQSEPQRDEPTEHDYRLLGMGHPDNNFAEEKYKAYLNRHKETSPLLAQAGAGEVGTSGQYQQQYAAGYNQYQPTQSQQHSPPQNDALLKKLNYMIHLLEEQKNEQTNNVTEELILYIFLGIFVIFVVDSFTRVGRYKR